jgi:hypothetical protein
VDTDFVANEVPEDKRITYNPEMLRLYPSFERHDECQSSKVRWLKAPRIVAAEGTLHETVIERLKLDVACEYSGYKPYRPEPLRDHPHAAAFFTVPPPPVRTPWFQRILGLSRD